MKAAKTNGVFLKADWRNLAMLNYEVEPSVLAAFVPAGTELDRWNGRLFVSLVGFRFLRTRVWGLPIPLHCNFDEVNLRFYVRRKEGSEIRRGVVFIREIVPRRAIATLARNLYGERYVALPMRHRLEIAGEDQVLEYGWRSGAEWKRLRLRVAGNPMLPGDGSEDQFITEHYWGYAAQRNGATTEYRVEHPPWRVWSARDARLEGDVAGLYGKKLAVVLGDRPASAFLAEGSEVTVFRGRKINIGT